MFHACNSAHSNTTVSDLTENDYLMAKTQANFAYASQDGGCPLRGYLRKPNFPIELMQRVCFNGRVLDKCPSVIVTVQ